VPVATLLDRPGPSTIASARRSSLVRIFTDDLLIMKSNQSRHSFRCAAAVLEAAFCLGESLFIGNLVSLASRVKQLPQPF